MNNLLFRLPDTETAYEMANVHTEEVRNLEALGNRPGYVFAPFMQKADCPTLLFQAEDVSTWSIPATSAEVHFSYTDNGEECHRQYRRQFRECLQHLSSGAIRKIVLSRTLSLQFSCKVSDSDLRQLFIVACNDYPHSYVSLVPVPSGGHWLIATPEVLLEDAPAQMWHTMALAATMSVDEGEGLPPASWSEKDREEQHIVAAYIAQRLQAAGCSCTASLLHTLTAGQLVHLCTDFTFPRTASFGRVVTALHPTPAVCGFPTVSAQHLIAATEQHDRAYYAGFSGPISLPCGTHLYVTLRCMHLLGDRACLYAGGGLLAASDCEREWEETQRKLKTMLHVLR